MNNYEYVIMSVLVTSRHTAPAVNFAKASADLISTTVTECDESDLPVSTCIQIENKI